MIPYRKLFNQRQLHILTRARKIAYLKGQRVFMVGGTTRDLLLGRPDVDLDLVVEGQGLPFARELARQLGGRLAYHERFLTASIYWAGEKVDVATARREYYPHPGALPEVEPATIAEDLARRDFSINALALALTARDPGEILDPFNGRADLEAGAIRVLHPASFRDDPTRLLRGVRLATRLHFQLAGNTRELAREALAAGYLDQVAPRRFWQEFILLLKEPRPVAAWEALLSLGWRGLPGGEAPPDMAAGYRTEKLLRQWQWLGLHPPDAMLVYFLTATAKLSPAALEEVLEELKWGRKRRRVINAARVLQQEYCFGPAPGLPPGELLAGPRPAPEALIFALAQAGASQLPGWALPGGKGDGHAPTKLDPVTSGNSSHPYRPDLS
ncbi:CCA tRNA nucleotidyltransferase [Moorella sp. Hama-1]|uniref:CCA tRNA nucleotidyltransferase n=1 Tax=Moorella sp. Hama-1 TaxID=2138101 RepID=UPI000D657AA8|nr:CCA tRNA nucleotidyltransferase [Moorella sp. Hama-1]BCV21524.1 polynucleotide adenylyltransferase [Moorella sp. Hama-1]